MNSEKVKEIKQALEGIVNATGLRIEINYNGDLHADILTLINELEQENERLTEEKNLYKKQFNELEPRFFGIREENKELKQDLKKSIDMQKEMLDGFKLSTKEVEENLAREIPNLLKQFAEMLKEKLEECSPFFGCDLEDLEFAVNSNKFI